MPDQDMPLKTKYIIALLASEPSFFVDYAQRNFAGIANGYLLSQHAKPHVSLVHFYGTEDDYLAANEFLKTVKSSPQPRFTKSEFGHDDDPEFLWAGLTVASENALVGLHNSLVNFLKVRGINVLNRPRGLFEPHLTFGRIMSPKVTFTKPIIPVIPFYLAIGKGDKLGQFIEVLNVYNMLAAPTKSSIKSKL